MDNKTAKILIFLLLTVFFVMGAKSVFTIDLINELTSEQLKVRENAAETILNNHKQLIKQLVKLASEKVEPLPSSDPRFIQYPWHDSKHLSIILLGDLRADESVPILLENIEYKNPESIAGSYLDTAGWYPAVKSLIMIGMPAVESVIKKMATYDKKCVARENCIYTLRGILGIPLAKEKLRIYLKETNDPITKKNIEALLPLFKTEDEKYQEELEQRRSDARKKEAKTDANKPGN